MRTRKYQFVLAANNTTGTNPTGPQMQGLPDFSTSKLTGTPARIMPETYTISPMMNSANPNQRACAFFPNGVNGASTDSEFIVNNYPLPRIAPYYWGFEHSSGASAGLDTTHFVDFDVPASQANVSGAFNNGGATGGGCNVFGFQPVLPVFNDALGNPYDSGWAVRTREANAMAATNFAYTGTYWTQNSVGNNYANHDMKYYAHQDLPR